MTWGRLSGASAGEVGQRLLSLGEPAPPRFERSRGPLARSCVAFLIRLLDLALQLLDRLADLLDRVPGPRQRLGVGPAPLDVLGLSNRVIDLLQAALKPVLR